MLFERAQQARMAFTNKHSHPAESDDQKAPHFYAEISKEFGFDLVRQQKKLAFIVVAHRVHTLPYFLEAVAKLGTIVSIIAKGSGCVPEVMNTIGEVYREFLSRNITKKTLSEDKKETTLFLQSLIEKWENYQFVILDHGGYFAPRIDVLNSFQDKIAGVIEHTLNGEIKYKESAFRLHSPLFSIASSALKAGEDAYVAESIVSTLQTKIYGGDGINQELSRVKNILIIGYGHIGEKVAHRLRFVTRHQPETTIRICDFDAQKLKSARASGFEASDQTVDLVAQSELIITATSSIALKQEHFLAMEDRVCIACVTSGDDQFDSTILREYEKIKTSMSMVSHYKHRINGKNLLLAADGGSVNFLMGSTPHPILHAVLASVCVSTVRCISPSEIHPAVKIPNTDIQCISDGDAATIKKIHEGIFGISTYQTATFGIIASDQPFFGRANELKQLEGTLNRHQMGVITQGVMGTGGIGKTSLAKSYVKYVLKEKKYDWIGWFDATTEQNLYEGFVRLARQLNITILKNAVGAMVDDVYRALSKYSHLLIVFDDASKNSVLKRALIGREWVDFSPRIYDGQTVHQIVTTQNANFGTTAMIQLGVLTLPDATAFIQFYCEKLTDDQAQLLATTLGFFPLALRQAVAYLKHDPECTVDKYCANFNTASAQQVFLSSQELAPEDHTYTVYKTWDITLKTLMQKNIHAVPLLNQLSYFSTEKIPLVFFEKIDRRLLYEAIEVLKTYALIEIESEQAINFLRIHPLLQIVVRLRQKNNEINEITDDLNQALQFVYDGVMESSVDLRLQLPHTLSVIRHHQTQLGNELCSEKCDLLLKVARFQHYDLLFSRQAHETYLFAKQITEQGQLKDARIIDLHIGLANTAFSTESPLQFVGFVDQLLDFDHLTADHIIRFLECSGMDISQLGDVNILRPVLDAILHPSMKSQRRIILPSALQQLGQFDFAIVYLMYQGQLGAAVEVAKKAYSQVHNDPTKKIAALYLYVETQMLFSGKPMKDAVDILQQALRLQHNEKNTDPFWNDQLQLLLSLTFACQNRFQESHNQLFSLWREMIESGNEVGFKQRVISIQSIVNFLVQKYEAGNRAHSFGQAYRLLGRLLSVFACRESHVDDHDDFLSRALTCFEHAEKYDETSVITHYEYAEALLKKGDYENATHQFLMAHTLLFTGEKDEQYEYDPFEFNLLPDWMHDQLIDKQKADTPCFSICFLTQLFVAHITQKKAKCTDAICLSKLKSTTQHPLSQSLINALEIEINTKQNKFLSASLFQKTRVVSDGGAAAAAASSHSDEVLVFRK